MPDRGEYVGLGQRAFRQVGGGVGAEQEIDQPGPAQQPCGPGLIAQAAHRRERPGDLRGFFSGQPRNLMLADRARYASGAGRVRQCLLDGVCPVGPGDRSDAEPGAERGGRYLGEELPASFQGCLGAVDDQQPALTGSSTRQDITGRRSEQPVQLKCGLGQVAQAQHGHRCPGIGELARGEQGERGLADVGLAVHHERARTPGRRGHLVRQRVPFRAAVQADLRGRVGQVGPGPVAQPPGQAVQDFPGAPVRRGPGQRRAGQVAPQHQLGDLRAGRSVLAGQNRQLAEQGRRRGRGPVPGDPAQLGDRGHPIGFVGTLQPDFRCLQR